MKSVPLSSELWSFEKQALHDVQCKLIFSSTFFMSNKTWYFRRWILSDESVWIVFHGLRTCSCLTSAVKWHSSPHGVSRVRISGFFMWMALVWKPAESPRVLRRQRGEDVCGSGGSLLPSLITTAWLSNVPQALRLSSRILWRCSHLPKT